MYYIAESKYLNQNDLKYIIILEYFNIKFFKTVLGFQNVFKFLQF